MSVEAGRERGAEIESGRWKTDGIRFLFRYGLVALAVGAVTAWHAKGLGWEWHGPRAFIVVLVPVFL